MRGKGGGRSTLRVPRTGALLFFFNDMGLPRRHIKYEHLHKLFPRHKYFHANLVNVEIPREMRFFAGIKIMSENGGRSQ